MKNDNKSNDKAFGKSNSQRLSEQFVPATREELEEYARRAAVREEERKKLKLQNLK